MEAEQDEDEEENCSDDADDTAVNFELDGFVAAAGTIRTLPATWLRAC